MARRPSRRLATAFTLLLVAAPALAQQQDAARAVPPARPADVESVDAILTALYDVISGPAGQARDWDRFRSLFVPGARLMPVARGQDGEPARVIVWSPDEYAARAGASLERSGFFENEIGRVMESFGAVTHAFSAYESRRTADGEVFARGINSIQLVDDGTRWWVISILWDSERPDNPIPEKYIRR